MTVYKNNKTPNVSRKKLIWSLKKVSILSLFTCSILEKNVNKIIQHVSRNINENKLYILKHRMKLTVFKAHRFIVNMYKFQNITAVCSLTKDITGGFT